LLTDTGLRDTLQAVGTGAKAVRDGDYCAMHKDEQATAEEACQDGKHGDTLREELRVNFHQYTYK
jgi:hypothetical protein